MKKLFMLMAILMVAVMGITGCGGSSATKDGTLGSSKEEITKVYGQGKAIGRGFEFNNGTYIGFYKGLAAEAVDRNNGLDNKDSVIYKMLPSDAKEVPNADVKSLKKDESYTTVKAYSSKSLSEKRKNDPAFKDYNIVMIEQQTMKGKKMARLEWLFDYNDAGNNSNNGNKAANTQPAPKKESSSLFSSTKKVTCEELIAAIRFDNSHKNNNDYENKNVELTAQVVDKGVANGKSYICVYYNYDEHSRFPIGNDYVVSLSDRTGNSYHALTDAIYITVNDPSILNKINKGNIVKVKGKLTELKLDNPRKANAYSTKNGVKFKEVPWGNRVVLIEADKLEF